VSLNGCLCAPSECIDMHELWCVRLVCVAVHGHVWSLCMPGMGCVGVFISYMRHANPYILYMIPRKTTVV
jgi:hypothetical protein